MIISQKIFLVKNSKMSFEIFLIVLILGAIQSDTADIPESNINKLHEPEAECQFSVHEKGPNGKEVDSKYFVFYFFKFYKTKEKSLYR